MKKLNQEVLDWIKSAGIAVLLTVLLLQIAWPMRSNGSSMENTLYNNQFVVTSKLTTYLYPIKPQDIIILKIRYDGKKMRIIKRVIGVAGDHIQIRDGVVYRNGQVLDEPYVKGNTAGSVDVVVGEGYVFVMGDNRGVSLDSRALGPVSLKSLKGKVILKVFPFDFFR